MRKLIFMLAFLLTAGMHVVYAQTTIRGAVTDDKGEPVPGANVRAKGYSDIGTISDLNGQYSLSVPNEATVLVFSFVGMAVKEVDIAGQTTINVMLSSEDVGIDEVVVTALGISKEKKALGYAATSVGGEDITATKNSSAMSSLQGKVAGVSISGGSGAPGASTKVVLRGYSSITGSNQPLYIVDGVPINNSNGNFYTGSNSAERTADMGNRANDINPEDIEDITILKGASATALYGSRAANGVIMITTKKGKANEKLSVTFSSSVTMSDILMVPQTQEMFGQGWDGHFAFEENGSWGPKLDGKERVWGNIVLGDDGISRQQVKPFSFQESRWKDFYEKGWDFSNSIALTGGNEKTTFYASYANVNQDGIVPTDNDSYKRNTITFRASTTGQKLKSSFSLNYINKHSSFVYTGQGNSSAGPTLYQDIIQIPIDHSIVDSKDYKSDFYNLDNYFTPYADNPYFIVNENGNRYNEDRIFGGVTLEYSLFENLTASWRLGGDVSNAQFKEWGAIGRTTPGSPNNGTRNDVPGLVSQRTRFARELNSDFMLNYNTNFMDGNLGFNALVGYNVNERFFDNTSSSVTNLTIPEFYNLSNSSDIPVVTQDETKRRLVGVYGQVDLSYKDFLYMSLLARNDWSSTLPENSRSFFYPGVNMSFLLSEAVPALKDYITLGKLRASWGQTGNDAAPYQIFPVYIQGNASGGFGNLTMPLDGVNGFELSNQIGNSNLQPEITTEYEFGADFRFLNSRIGFDFAYYNRESKNQILPVPLDPSTGFSTITKNIGTIQNKGYELSFYATPIKINDFSWDITVTFTQNRNEVLSLIDGLDQIVITGAYSINFVAKPGQPLGVYEGPGFKYDPQGRVIVNELGIPVQSKELVEYGNAEADYTMGFSTRFAWKGLSLSASADYRKGGIMYSYTGRLMEFVGNRDITAFNERNPWIVENSVQEIKRNDGTVYYQENRTPIAYDRVGDFWNRTGNPTGFRNSVTDKTFFKLREVVLSYSLPNSLLSKLPIGSIDVSIFGRNLLLWTPDSNRLIDPESSTFGNDLRGEFGEFANGPSTKSFGGSLRITF